MRLDKFLCETHAGSRSEVKNYIKKGRVVVNGQIIRKPEFSVIEDKDFVTLDGKQMLYEKFRYFMLHKPSGVITATTDSRDKTVLDLISEPGKEDLFPIGRLDKDTEGLLIITNDGELAHQLLSPKKHVDKTYYCKVKEPFSNAMREQLEHGVDIGEKKETLPATVNIISEYEVELTIQEGKFHQIKRMMHAVDNEIVYLKRISMGSVALDSSLKKGEYRPLSHTEIKKLKEY